MTVSALAEMTMLSPNCSSRDGHQICKFTPHYMAGDCTIEVCGDIFQPTSRQASSNYGIGSDGRIGCYVDEDDRAWTSSSYENDSQAITVEVANIDNATGEITQEAWQSLVKLATDVCNRYQFKLVYTGGPDGSLTMHKMFADTSCPGPWIEAHMQELADTVNANLASGNFNYSGTVSGFATGKGIVTDLAQAYGAAINANILPQKEEMQQYMITVEESSPEIDYTQLKTSDIFGICFYAGSYFTESHTVNERFRIEKLADRIKAADEANFPYALYTIARAQNSEEALEELHQIELLVRRFPPKLGFWIKLGLNPKKPKTNKRIIKLYQEKLESLGLKDQIGFYDTKKHLDLVEWKEIHNDWYWWMDKHLEELDKITGYPSPKFFMYEDPDDKLYEPDMKATLSSLKMGGGPSKGAVSGAVTGSGTIEYDGRTNVYTYMAWQMVTYVDSPEYELKAAAGMNFDEEGFGVINGRYVVATTTHFGAIGDYIDFTLESGQILQCILGETKSNRDWNWSEYGHLDGNTLCVVEFVVDQDSWYHIKDNPGNPSNHPEWAGQLQGYVKRGSYWD